MHARALCRVCLVTLSAVRLRTYLPHVGQSETSEKHGVDHIDLSQCRAGELVEFTIERLSLIRHCLFSA